MILNKELWTISNRGLYITTCPYCRQYKSIICFLDHPKSDILTCHFVIVVVGNVLNAQIFVKVDAFRTHHPFPRCPQVYLLAQGC
jgi:hypothetical protein